MRRLFLILLMIASLIGLPRLADKFRDPRQAQKGGPAQTGTGRIASESDAQAAVPNHETQSAAAVAPLPAARPVPVLLPPVPPAPVSSAAKPPETQDDLVVAIKKELTRLKLYDGPITQYWNRPVRAAAKKFVQHSGLRVRHLKPSGQLLHALQSTNAETSAPVSADLPRLDMQVTQPLPEWTGSATGQAETLEMPAAGIVSNSYLPPWQEHGSAVEPEDRAPLKPAAGRDMGLPGPRKAAATQDTVPAVRRSRHAARSSKRYRTARGYRTFRPGRAYAGLYGWRTRRPYYFRSANFGWTSQ